VPQLHDASDISFGNNYSDHGSGNEWEDDWEMEEGIENYPRNIAAHFNLASPFQRRAVRGIRKKCFAIRYEILA
jgi:hypothetical protein